jgi:hypothetical protein
MSDQDSLIDENRRLRENLKWAQTGAFMILAVCLTVMNSKPDQSSGAAAWISFAEAAVIWGVGKLLIKIFNRD